MGHLSDEQGVKADEVSNIMLSKGLVTVVRWVIYLMNRETKLIKLSILCCPEDWWQLSGGSSI